ncbi:hypothetical protein B0H16DRAFT_1467329 [Mycena metata]|uniref:Uncharacterized protein n=1 Tax=Mycena metata TaxID=1033252 RepID=A0AAD7I4W5_9AGAR|nr:hypothetical protein B0H16DRAFT_1467329 [Mycena metata]
MRGESASGESTVTVPVWRATGNPNLSISPKQAAAADAGAARAEAVPVNACVDTSSALPAHAGSASPASASAYVELYQTDVGMDGGVGSGWRTQTFANAEAISRGERERSGVKTPGMSTSGSAGAGTEGFRRWARVGRGARSRMGEDVRLPNRDIRGDIVLNTLDARTQEKKWERERERERKGTQYESKESGKGMRTKTYEGLGGNAFSQPNAERDLNWPNIKDAVRFRPLLHRPEKAGVNDQI